MFSADNLLGKSVFFSEQINASAIVAASSLSFVGLGVKVPSPEWGALLSAGRAYVRTAPYMTLYPGLAIMVTVLALNLVGDGLRDCLDPKLRR